ncbi:MAG: flagellar motor switch protein FliN [Gemmatimonadetes bacterium]|nr:flagellar motor switch protein FliN [Gemmatimonadota bacterium]
MSEEKNSKETIEETAATPADGAPESEAKSEAKVEATAEAPAATATADADAETAAAGEGDAAPGAGETGSPDAVNAESVPGGADAAAGADGADGEPVRQVSLESLQDTAAQEAGVDNWGLVLDVVVPVSVDLGRCTMAIKDVMRIRAGSVVTLDKPLGEPVDLRINGEVIGSGEVVVVGDQIGIQIVDLKQKGRSK